jgi:peptide/nickel transport system permease protein
VTEYIRKHPLGVLGGLLVLLFVLAGIYAPLLASSKPIAVMYQGKLYFPLLRYLFYSGFYTRAIDLFFNLLMFTFPLMLLSLKTLRWLMAVIALQLALFTYFLIWGVPDPAGDPALIQARMKAGPSQSWADELQWMNPYARLGEVIRFRIKRDQHKRWSRYAQSEDIPSLLRLEEGYLLTRHAAYYQEKQKWLEEQNLKIQWIIMPFFRHFHWEEDVGGDQKLNQRLPWWELTRVNRKDLMAALIFGVRISLVVGFLAIALALMIGVPIGAFAGYYGGTFDIIVSRLLEIWESMPTFFMLLLVVAILQSKSIFIIIAVIGIFGWTGFSRYIRGEFFKQRSLAYVEASRAIGFADNQIIFQQILPNAIPPLITLLPFAIMGAITSEAGLSFLGLGEEGSSSWGVLMDEGRSAFPAEAYLLWPPAILLTLLLVSIALVGDALRDEMDPKLKT